MTVTLPSRGQDPGATWFDDDVAEPESTGVDHVVVRLGGGRYAVCAPDVAEVAALPRATRVPGTAAWVTGVVNWRGHVLPLLDVRTLLGLDAGPLPSSARLVVISAEGLEAGLVAEAVAGLVEVPPDLEPAPSTLAPGAGRLVSGLADGGPAGRVAVLGTAALLALRTRASRG